MIRRVCTALTALLCASVALRAQTASYTFVGPGCLDNQSNEVLTFRVSGLPRLGTSYTLTVSGSFAILDRNRQVVFERTGFVATGFSNKLFGPIPLPFDTRALGPSWCGHVRVSFDLLEVCPRSTSTVDFHYAIPNDARLLGLSFYQQTLGIVTKGQPGQSFSRSGHALIGT